MPMNYATMPAIIPASSAAAAAADPIAANSSHTSVSPLSATTILADGGPFLTSAEALNLYQQSRQLLPAQPDLLAADSSTGEPATIAVDSCDAVKPPAATASSASAPLCRICRGSGEQVALIECPCRCRGTMGYVHPVCLQRWHLVRKVKVCEICHEAYEFDDLHLPAESAWQRLRNLLRPEYMGRIVKTLINFAALSYLTYLNSKQLQQFIELAKTQPPHSNPMLVVYLMGSGLSNFTYFEWTLYTINRMALLLDHWWNRAQFVSEQGGEDGEDVLGLVDVDELLSAQTSGFAFLNRY